MTETLKGEPGKKSSGICRQVRDDGGFSHVPPALWCNRPGDPLRATLLYFLYEIAGISSEQHSKRAGEEKARRSHPFKANLARARIPSEIPLRVRCCAALPDPPWLCCWGQPGQHAFCKSNNRAAPRLNYLSWNIDPGQCPPMTAFSSPSQHPLPGRAWEERKLWLHHSRLDQPTAAGRASPFGWARVGRGLLHWPLEITAPM